MSGKTDAEEPPTAAQSQSGIDLEHARPPNDLMLDGNERSDPPV